MIRSAAEPVSVFIEEASIEPEVCPSRVLRIDEERLVSESTTASSPRPDIPEDA